MKKKIKISIIILIPICIILGVIIYLINDNSYNSLPKNDKYEDLILDPDWCYDIDDEHVVYDDTGYGYINNRIIIYFTTEDEQQKQNVINSINGKVIGYYGGKYQVEVDPTDENGLEELCEKVRNMDGVFNAMYDLVFQISMEEDLVQSIPNDPWKDTVQGIFGTDWDGNNPNGLNWWLETIQAVSAWEHKERFNNIKVGVIDIGFDEEHEDLDIKVLNSDVNSIENHGTHVAGIIGAKRDNEIGITGVIPHQNLNLYGVEFQK